MLINDEEKNAFTQSVMGDTEGGGGGAAVYVTYDTETATLDATFNELVEYFNDDKLVFTKGTSENDGEEYRNWGILTVLHRIPNGGGALYYAIFSSFPFYEGSSHLDALIFAATDPDVKMMPD